MNNGDTQQYDSALAIAMHNMRACCVDDGIVASADHYDDFWARDAFFASWGVMAAGDTGRAQSLCRLFARHQKANGHIARRLDQSHVWLKYLGVRVARVCPRPKYAGAYGWAALDPNLLFVITCGKVYDETRDAQFLADLFPAMTRAMAWLARYERGGLLHERMFANWMDTIVKIGHVLYTNALYAEAVRSYAAACRAMSREADAARYRRKHDTLVAKINARFWNGTHYDDWITSSRRHHYFSSDGNVLALLFHIADDAQVAHIIRYIEIHHMDVIPLTTNYPSYPWWRVAMRMYAVGMPGYQNNHAAWTWIGSLYAIALHERGYSHKARMIYDRITAHIVRHNMIYELYDRRGMPYRGWLWKSAGIFAWGAGLYLWMHHSLHIPLNTKVK